MSDYTSDYMIHLKLYNHHGLLLQQKSYVVCSLEKIIVFWSLFFFFFLINLNWTLSDKAVASLKESEKLLLECTEGDYKDNSTSLECLRDIKVTSKDISQQLSG